MPSITERGEILAEAKERVRLITTSLPGIVDPRNLSYKAKIPYKVILYRETLMWRTEELARAACDLYERNDLGAAIVLTRATMEGSAALCDLIWLVERQLDQGISFDLDEQVMRRLMGHRTNDEMPQAINILSILSRVEKKVPHIRESYEHLSEYSHPNWSGTSYLYAKNDQENLLTELGKYLRSPEKIFSTGINCLIGSLILFEYAYNKFPKLMPEFIELCEKALETNRP